ncbi:MAG: GIY-YIG nuclease family protein [Paludibacteraceae bacterium]
MPNAYMYILKCSNGMYYTGSTVNLERRLQQHQNGEGSNFTGKHLPVTLVYYEEFSRISDAFYREKQIQKWSRKKKEALIRGEIDLLHELASCKNISAVISAPLDDQTVTDISAPLDDQSGG